MLPISTDSAPLRRFAVVLFLCILTGAFGIGVGFADDDEEEEEAGPAETIEDYIAALEEFEEEKVFEESGLLMTAKVIPDAYLFELARKYRSCKRSGYDGYRTSKEIKKAAKELKKMKGKPRFLFSLEATLPKTHYFFRKPLEKGMIRLDLPKKKTVLVSGLKGDLKYAEWGLDLAKGAYQKHRLGYFRKFKFVVEPKAKVRNKDNKPFVVGLKDIVVYEQPERQHYYDSYGINPSRRDLKVDDFVGLPKVSPSFTFYPAEWTLPKPPEALQAILDEIDSNKK